jgi:methionine synthase II (cobalamin-independent)
MTPITKDIYIEELVRDYPFSVRFLSERGVKCIACGEPVWGTLEEAAREKNLDDAAIEQLVEELRAMA